MELIFRDLGVIENRLSRLQAKKKNIPAEQAEEALLEKCQACLLEERPLRDLQLTQDEIRTLSGFAFVTLKPEMIVANLDETQTDEHLPLLESSVLASEKGAEFVGFRKNGNGTCRPRTEEQENSCRTWSERTGEETALSTKPTGFSAHILL
jgi:ribosome-binding ATPase YchF (GTP1/OBG family)